MQDDRRRSSQLEDPDKTDSLPVLSALVPEAGSPTPEIEDLRAELAAREATIVELRNALALRGTQKPAPLVDVEECAARLASARRELEVLAARVSEHREFLRTREWRRAYADSRGAGLDDHPGAPCSADRQLPVLMPESGAPILEGAQQLAARDARSAEQTAEIARLRAQLAEARALAQSGGEQIGLLGEALAQARKHIDAMEEENRRTGELPIPEQAGWSVVRLDLAQERGFALGRRTRIGRAEGCEILLESLSVSRQHALALIDDQGALIEDLNSTNGIYLNGRKVKRARLRDGDALTIGDVKFRVSGPAAVSAAKR